VSSRRGLALTLVLLYVAAFAVRVWVTRDRVSAGHGDVAGYYHVAQNLATGRGFVQDFVAEYLEDPRAIPTPSNTWWLPLPSLIAAAGMKIAGDTAYVSAKYAMITLSSLIPLLCFFAGWFLLRSRVAGLATGILAVGFHLYLDQPNATLSHGPYALFAAGGLLIVMAWREHPKVLPWFGLFFGATYLCRGDSQALVVGLVVTLLAEAIRRRRERNTASAPPQPLIPWRALVISIATFLAIAGPWWARNLEVLGAPMPSGQRKVTFARSYEDWFYSDSSHLSAERYREWGWENIFEQKKTGVLDAIQYTPFVMYRSVTREQESKPGEVDYHLGIFGKWVLTPLLFAGLLLFLVTRRWAVASLLLHLALLTAIYGVVFPAIARESYRSSMFSVFPVFLAAIIGGLGLVLTPLKRLSERSFQAALLCGALLLAAGNVFVAVPVLRTKHAGIKQLLGYYRDFGEWARRKGIDDQIILARNPWQLTAETGMRSAIIPSDGVKGLIERARIYQARYLLDEFVGGHSILVWRPVLNALIAEKKVVPVFEDDPPRRFRVYRLSDELLAGQ
jgi:hypothetical protein